MGVKKYISIFVFGLLSLSACSQGERDCSEGDLDRWMRDSEKIKVLSTTAMIDDIVGQVGGDRIDHIALICGEIDPHSYELVKGDDEKLERAQVIFYNGLGLEHGASLRYQLQSHTHSIALGNRVQEENGQEMISVGNQIDPHIWMDISLWSEIINPIIEELSQVDPEGRGGFIRNGEILRTKMEVEHQRIRQEFQKIPETKRYLVSSHDAFNYFTRAYLAEPTEILQAQWQKRFASPEGLSPDGQLSASDIQKIVDHLARYQIQVIFPESNVSRDSLKKIVHACGQNGLKVNISSEVLYGDAMGEKSGDGDLYLKMIAYDADVLLSTWGEQSHVAK